MFSGSRPHLYQNTHTHKTHTRTGALIRSKQSGKLWMGGDRRGVWGTPLYPSIRHGDHIITAQARDQVQALVQLAAGLRRIKGLELSLGLRLSLERHFIDLIKYLHPFLLF